MSLRAVLSFVGKFYYWKEHRFRSIYTFIVHWVSVCWLVSTLTYLLTGCRIRHSLQRSIILLTVRPIVHRPRLLQGLMAQVMWWHLHCFWMRMHMVVFSGGFWPCLLALISLECLILWYFWKQDLVWLFAWERTCQEQEIENSIYANAVPEALGELEPLGDRSLCQKSVLVVENLRYVENHYRHEGTVEEKYKRANNTKVYTIMAFSFSS